jgi:hypothetical protein
MERRVVRAAGRIRDAGEQVGLEPRGQRVAAGFGGVSSLPSRELVSAAYGAGVWHIDFAKAPSNADGIAEDSRTTWGNTLGWNVMPGADTWSAKEYKGNVYTGDMLRGFDVYTFVD